MSGLLTSVSRADERLLRAVLTRRRPLLDRLVRRLTRLGNAEVILPATLLLFFLGDGGRFEAAATVAFVSLIASHAVVQAIKRSVRRERPRLPVGLGFLIVPEDRFSLPSGHATAGLSVALPCALALGGLAGALLLTLGLAVGLSRCYLGVHYPSDVLAGWSLAALTVALVTTLA
jgi:undecaprenyl-diphosphatase